MNKEIKLEKNTKLMFCINIFLLISIFLFNYIFKYLNVYHKIINIFTIINISILVISVIFNIFVILKQDKYNNKIWFKRMIIGLIIYVLLNTFIVYLINKPYQLKLNRIENELVSYCDYYECETYEVKNEKEHYNFYITKKYLDYDNMYNNIEINNYYDIEGVKNIKLVIYSRKEMFSELLINEEVKYWLNNFDISTNYETIYKAFTNSPNKITENGITYEIVDNYENNTFKVLKTIITLKINSK